MTNPTISVTSRAFYLDASPEELVEMREELMDFAVRNMPNMSDTLRQRIFTRVGALTMASAAYDMTGSGTPGTTTYAWYHASIDVLTQTDDLRPTL